MGNMYRILIENGDGETVADLTAPVEMLAQFAPEAVARLLREATPEAEGDTPTAPESGNYGPGQPKERRRRRTKAEMEAARSPEAGVRAVVDAAKAKMEAARAAAQHPAPEISTDPIPAEVVPDVSIDRNAYNPFGPK